MPISLLLALACKAPEKVPLEEEGGFPTIKSNDPTLQFFDYNAWNSLCSGTDCTVWTNALAGIFSHFTEAFMTKENSEGTSNVYVSPVQDYYRDSYSETNNGQGLVLTKDPTSDGSYSSDLLDPADDVNCPNDYMMAVSQITDSAGAVLAYSACLSDASSQVWATLYPSSAFGSEASLYFNGTAGDLHGELTGNAVDSAEGTFAGWASQDLGTEPWGVSIAGYYFPSDPAADSATDTGQ